MTFYIKKVVHRYCMAMSFHLSRGPQVPGSTSTLLRRTKIGQDGPWGWWTVFLCVLSVTCVTRDTYCLSHTADI